MAANPATYAPFLSPEHASARTAARRRRERAGALLVAAGASVVLAALLAIPLFLLANLAPWASLPDGEWGRIGVLFAGSAKAAICALLVALPLGIASAVFTAYFCAARLREWIKPAIETLEAIPTVVLGLVATATLAPWLKSNVATLLAWVVILPASLFLGAMLFGARARTRQGWLPLWLIPLVIAIAAVTIALSGSGAPLIAVRSPWNATLVGLALGFAAVPLVFSIAEDALALVPASQMQAALSLGATRWQALRSIVLPAASSGLSAAVVLGMSRCIGETMIVLMASGNTPLFDANPVHGLRTISAELAIGLPEAAPSGSAYRALLLAALVLFALTFALNSLAQHFRAGLRRRADLTVQP